MKKNLIMCMLTICIVSANAFGATLRIEDTDAGTLSYDGSLKSYSGADNGTAINLTNDPNKRIVWSYSSSESGTYELKLRYTRKSSMASTANIYVNGSLVQQISFPETASSVFTTYALNASLSSGTNQIILETIEDAEFADIDWIEITGGGTSSTTYTLTTTISGQGSVSPSSGTYAAGTSVALTATPASGWQFSNWSGGYSGNPTTVVMDANKYITAYFSEISQGSTSITIQENQTGFCSVDGAIESEHSGYTGDGYANTENITGSGIDYKVNIGTAGSYTIQIRYASSSDRPAKLIQNGSTVASSISLPSSGAWTTWSTVTTSASLSAGTSDLRLEATSSEGLPNIDYITISGTNISTADCDPDDGDDGDDDGDDDSDGGTDADFALIGYATQNGGTTGGSGGTTVYASTGDQILNYIDGKKDGDYSNGLIIIINGTITPSNTSATKIDIKECDDISIIGSGSGGEFNGIGIKIYKASNVILRNLRVHHVDIGDKDCISIEGPADHIWVDHCELYNEYGDNVDKDYYDGLLDAKAESEYITYSWNYFHDSWKTMLVGSSDGDDHDRKITAHHNIYENCNSRMPLYRFGTGHFFNNYYIDGASTAINSRMGACLRIENNYFKNVLNPYVSAYSDDDGYGQLINNILVNSPFSYSSDVHELQSCNLSVPYSYSAVLNTTASVPSITTQYAGVGKLSSPTSYTVKSANETLSMGNIESNMNVSAYPNPFSGITTINFNLSQSAKVKIAIYDMMGRQMDLITKEILSVGVTEIDYSNPNLRSGVYILSIDTGSEISNTRLIIR